MNMRTRKLVGTVALLLLIAVYALLAMFAAVLVTGNKAAELAYFIVAGLGWVIPAAVLVKWMQRPDP